MHEAQKLDNYADEKDRNDGTIPPNRQQFEIDLDNYHADIKRIKNEIEESKKEIYAKHESRNELSHKKAEFASKLSKLKEDGIKLREHIEQIKGKRLDLEKDCEVRKKDQLEKYLAETEARYNSAQLSARDEMALVNKLNNMKRNMKNLGSLENLAAERRNIEHELEANFKQKNQVFRIVTEFRSKITKNRMETKEIARRICSRREELKNIHNERKLLIDTYESDRADYKNWVSERKTIKGTTVPMSFPITKKTTFIEDEELEPFYEQKRDCKRLLSYLENLKNQMKSVEQQHPIVIETPPPDDDEDSADELPSYLSSKLSVSHTIPTNGHLNKKQFKKGSQPLSHDIGIYNLFGVVEVDVPNVYSDVPRILEEVKAKLDFYMQQTTNELDWGEEFSGLDAMTTSIATTSDWGSTFTESMSDFGSVSSFNRVSSQASCTSPTDL